MSKMTPIQFRTIRSLARAYGHEWATGLDFAEVWPRNAGPNTETTTRGACYRAYADPVTAYDLGLEEPTPEQIETCRLWSAWIELHDRIESGYVPDTTEISAIAGQLWPEVHFPSTPHVALRHETCTGRTRWEVREDGSVRFEFFNGHVASYEAGPKLPHDTLLCAVEVTPDKLVCVDMDIDPDTENWLFWHCERIVGACAAIGVRPSVTNSALDAASKIVRIQLDAIRRSRDAQAARDARAKPVPPTKRIVGGTRQRRNARRRVNQ